MLPGFAGSKESLAMGLPHTYIGLRLRSFLPTIRFGSTETLMPIDVAIVEDKTEVLEGISFLLSSDERFRCCGRYGTAEDAIEEILQNAPAIVLMDIDLPGMSGIEAVYDLYHGGAPMSNQIARRVLEYLRPDSSGPDILDELSAREREVLNYLADGLLYKEIADKLNIALTTVRTHIHKIYEKLHVNNKAEAIKKMRRGSH